MGKRSVPDVYNLIDLAKLFDVSVSHLIEEKPDFETNKIFYDYKHMKTYIQTYAKAHKLVNTLKALPYAVQAHYDQFLKSSDIPYISHVFVNLNVSHFWLKYQSKSEPLFFLSFTMNGKGGYQKGDKTYEQIRNH